jgi:hypothetical protein
MKKYLLLFSVLVSTYTSFAQDSGITYQAVIYKPGGEQLPGQNNMSAPLANANICLQFSIIDSDKNTAYQEVVKTKTDDFGMVNLVIGTHGQSSGYAAGFNGVAWDNLNNNLRIAIDVKGGCSQFEQISNQPLTYVPMALYARKAESILGIVPIENGGTGANTTATAKVKLGLALVDNTSDLNKPLSQATQDYVTQQVENVTQQLENVAQQFENVTQQVENVTQQVENVVIADASTSEKGKIQLAGDLSGTAAAPTVPDLALKANIASPTFTGAPLAPTATAGTSTTQIATTAFVAAAISTVGSGGAHNIGDIYGGGIVFWVTTDGLHGLIAETIDQSTSSTWYNAPNIISLNSTHSTAGQRYTDWRLPTKNELDLLYLKKAVVGVFAKANYWSSTENTWAQHFDTGVQGSYYKSDPFYVRAVRAF